MFTGIVETTSDVLNVQARAPHLFIVIKRPESFDDLKIGDSIAINGACLTVAELTPSEIGFYVGVETQKICGWQQPQALVGRAFNLERSLKVGDRLHGHWVQGHVDARAQLVSRQQESNWLVLNLKTKSQDANLIWKKGSVTINGVSLTVNEVSTEGEWRLFSVGLIPETLSRTNLGEYQIGETYNLEFDWLAKAARASFSIGPQQQDLSNNNAQGNSLG